MCELPPFEVGATDPVCAFDGRDFTTGFRGPRKRARRLRNQNARAVFSKRLNFPRAAPLGPMNARERALKGSAHREAKKLKKPVKGKSLRRTIFFGRGRFRCGAIQGVDSKKPAMR